MTTAPLVQEQCIMPVPHEAQAATMRHVKLGSPSTVYAYHDRAGAVLGYICRFDTPEGKQILPLTYWQTAQGAGWRWKGFPEPRPLYGLDKLATHPQRPVLVCEGEKAADAAQQLVPDYVCITSSGGSNAAHKADWSCMRDRKVYIWPDHDEAGQKYAQAVATILSAGNQVRIITPPAGKTAGWDAADALAEGWDRTPVDALIVSAKYATPPTDTMDTMPSMSSVSGGDNWPEPKPVKFQLLPVEPLPIGILPEAYQAWIGDLAHRLQCPPDMAACAAITMTGAIIGAGCGICPKRRDDWLIIPNLFGAAIARPSVLLKSPTLQEAFKPMMRLEAEAQEEFSKSHAYFEAENEMTKAERDGIRKEMSHLVKKRSLDSDAKEMLKHKFANMENPDEPTLRRYRTNDATVEKLSELLDENSRGMLVFRDELMGLISSWEKEGRENDRAFYLEAWNGKHSNYSDRIGRGTIFTKNRCVSIFGGIQPDKLLAYLNECRKSNDGMFQRFQMMVYPDEPKNWTLVDEYPDTEAKNQAYETIKRLSEMDFMSIGAERKDEDSTPFLRYSPDAQDLFYEWLTDLEVRKLRGTAMEPMMAEHLGKFRKLMPALSLIFHLVDVASGTTTETGMVSLQAAERAAAWCEYLESHARRVYGLVESLPIKAATILATRVKKKALGTSFTVRDVYRRQWSFLTDKDIAQAACDILVDAGWLRESVTESSFGQRGKTDYLVNPKLWDGDHE